MSETTRIVAEESDMSSFEEFRKEQLKNTAVRFWWYFYGPLYIWRTVKIRIQARMRWQKCRRKRWKR